MTLEASHGDTEEIVQSSFGAFQDHVYERALDLLLVFFACYKLVSANFVIYLI